MQDDSIAGCLLTAELKQRHPAGHLEEKEDPSQLTDAPEELEEATLKTLKS